MRAVGALDPGPILTVSSAATTDIGAARSNTLSISGTTGITSFGTAPAGTPRWLTFQGVLTITYNSTSMILPGLASLTTVGGDTALFVSLGSGNWKCLAYHRVVGVALQSALTREYVSGQQTIVNGGTITLGHGLGSAFKLSNVRLVCVEADLGYAVGTTIDMGPIQSHSSGAYGFTVFVDPANTTTNIIVKVGSSGIYLATTGGIGGPTPITNSRWRIIVECWA